MTRPLTRGAVRYGRAAKRSRRIGRVREGRREPAWLSAAMVRAMHAAQVREHGGPAGVRDAGLLDASVARPRNKFAYGEGDLAVLAAAYAFAIVRNHPFADGNKRTGFVASAVFLGLNGVSLEAPEPEVVHVMRRLAAGTLTEGAYAAWIRAHAPGA